MVPEKVPGSLGAKPSQVQRVPGKVAEKAEKVLGIFGEGSGRVQRVQQGFQHLASRHASERFVKIKRCGAVAVVGDTTETYFFPLFDFLFKSFFIAPKLGIILDPLP